MGEVAKIVNMREVFEVFLEKKWLIVKILLILH